MAAALPPLRFVDAPPRSADLVIIGGGIVGAATAFFAARAGLSAVILEKRPALCTLTTPVSTGAFRLQFDNPEEIALVREGVDAVRALRRGRRPARLRHRRSGSRAISSARPKRPACSASRSG